MYPKHVELRIHQYNYPVTSSWHFTLFQSYIFFCNVYYDESYIITHQKLNNATGAPTLQVHVFAVVLLQTVGN